MTYKIDRLINDWVSGRTKKFYPDISELYGFEMAIREGKKDEITKKKYEEEYNKFSKEKKNEYKKKFGLTV